MMDNKLEEIRKRAEAGYKGGRLSDVYSDRRWLLGEVERLRAQVAGTADSALAWKQEAFNRGDCAEKEYERLDKKLNDTEAEVERLTQYAEEERSARHTAEKFQMKYADAFRRAETAEAEVDAQREELERLREVLEFYAKFDHYTNVQDLSQDWPHQIIQAPIIVDGGKKARRVLGWEE